MRSFFIIIVVLIIILYVQYYMKHVQDYEIVQMKLDNFKIDNLYEKKPIVIVDSLYKTKDLLTTIFAYSYMFKNDFVVKPETIYRNKYKFLVLSSEDNIAVKIINPKYKKEIKSSLQESNVQYVTVKLRENQVLILPPLWYYQTDYANVQAIGLNDIMSTWIYSVL